MEPRDLRPTNELFIANDVIATAKELQTHLSAVNPSEQPKMAVEAMEMLGDPRELYGSKKVLIHALGASVLFGGQRAASFDEELWHGTYLADTYMKANFSRFSYIQAGKIASICLSLVEANIIKSESNPEFVGEQIHSGVYVPVHAVETVLAA